MRYLTHNEVGFCGLDTGKSDRQTPAHSIKMGPTCSELGPSQNSSMETYKSNCAACSLDWILAIVTDAGGGWPWQTSKGDSASWLAHSIKRPNPWRSWAFFWVRA